MVLVRPDNCRVRSSFIFNYRYDVREYHEDGRGDREWNEQWRVLEHAYDASYRETEIIADILSCIDPK